jgi:transcriptional regulator GlxA family with amidase domain
MARGYRTNLWTTTRIALLIEEGFGVRYQPNHIGQLMQCLGWSHQKPERRCRTGAFVLAEAGLLNGKHATTHHDAVADLPKNFPEIRVERWMRYVQSDGVIFTAGGLSSGIDLALHIVELCFGREAAQTTADLMEYQGTAWKGNRQAVTRRKNEVE